MVKSEELFILCLLTGAKEIAGLEDPLEGYSEADAKAKLIEIMASLYDQEIISKDENDEIHIRDEYARISAAMSFPDILFELQTGEDISDYIYIKGKIYVHMKNCMDPEIELIENKVDLTDLLEKELMLTKCEAPMKITIPESDFNNAVDLYISGNLLQAAQLFDLEFDEVVSIMEKFVKGSNVKHFCIFKINRENPTKAVFRSVLSEDGTWIFRYCNGMISIFRCSPTHAIKEIILS